MLDKSKQNGKMKGLKRHPLGLRLVAFLMALIFPLTSNLWAQPARFVAPDSTISSEVVISEDIAVPAELGNIQEQYVAPNAHRTVILIQDAHEIPDAQRNIQGLIDHFQKQYQISLVALEGGSAQLDPQMFKSFPNQETLRKVFEEYFDRGELTGGVAATIFNEEKASYYGVEDWGLYEEGVKLYLKALESQPKILDQLEVLQTKLSEEKAKFYSKELLKADQLLEAFYENHTNLFEVLGKLSEIQKPEAGSELALLLEQSEQETKHPEDLSFEMKQVAEQVKALLQKRTDKESTERWVQFNAKAQAFQTSQITEEAFALFLREAIADYDLPIQVSKKFLGQAENQKRLQDIQGTKLFRDFESYVSGVEALLLKNANQKKIYQENQALRLLKKLAKLELSRSDWETLKAESGFLSENLKTLFADHRAFYENAEKRDTALHERLMALMDHQKAKSAILVAGGFHTEGLTRFLKSQEMSYVLLTPNIHEIPEATHYQAHMRGEVSWKKYLASQKGKASSYSAFVRGVRDELLKSEDNGKGQLLKYWRDQIIRDLANQNQLAKAYEYTQYIDEVIEPGKVALTGAPQADWFQKAEQFIQGLKKLELQNKLTEQNILRLLSPATIPSKTVNAQVLTSRLAEPLPALRSEVRAVPASRADDLKSVQNAVGQLEMASKRRGGTAQDGSDQTRDELEEDLKYGSRASVLELEADYGFLSDDHPAAKLIQTRLSKLLRGQKIKSEDWPRVHVLASEGWGVNAAALHDGTIIVSPELIRFIEYMEELDFVLLHEITHWLKKHIKDINLTIQQKSLVNILGVKRLSEYDADLTAFFQMSDPQRDTNPRGAITFLERIRSAEEGELAWDVDHGDTGDRILNQKEFTTLITFVNFDKPLTPINKDLQKGLVGLPIGGRISRIVKKAAAQGNLFDEWIRDLSQLTETADWPLLHFAMSRAYAEFSSLVALEKEGTGNGDHLLAFQKRQMEGYRQVLKKLLTRWNVLFSDKFAQLPMKTQTILKVILLESGTQIPVFSDRKNPAIAVLGLNHLSEAFNQWVQDARFFKEVTDALPLIDLSIERSALFNFGSSLAISALGENAAFDLPRGGVAVKQYLEKTAALLAQINLIGNAKGYSERPRTDISAPALAWSQVVLESVKILQDIGEWAAWERQFKRLSDEAAKRTKDPEIFIEPIVFRRAVENLDVQSEKSYPAVIKFYDDLQGDNLSETVQRLRTVLSSLDSLVGFDRADLNMEDPRQKELLAEVAILLKKLPEKIPESFARSLLLYSDTTKFQEDGYFLRKSIEDGVISRRDVISLVGKLIFISGEEYSTLSNWTEYLPSSFQHILTAVRWFQLVAEDDGAYGELIDQTNRWFIAASRSDVLSLIDFEKLNQLAEATRDFKGVEAYFGVSPRLKSTDVRLEQQPEWQRAAVIFLEESLGAEQAATSFFAQIDAHVKRWSIPTSIRSKSYHLYRIEDPYAEEFDRAKQRIIKKGFKLLGLDKKPLSERNLKQLLLLSFFFEAVGVRRSLQEYLVLRILNWTKTSRKNRASISKAIALTMKTYAPQGLLGGIRIFEIMDDEAKTPQELAKIEVEATHALRSTRDSKGYAGGVVSVEGVANFLMKEGGLVGVLLPLLISGQDDSALRQNISEGWWSIYHDGIARYINENYISKAAINSDTENQAWAESPLDSLDRSLFSDFWEKIFGSYRSIGGELPPRYYSPEDFLQFIYQFNSVDRIVLLRKLLTGPNGALRKQENRQALIDSFLNHYVRNEQETNLFDRLKKILETLVEAAPEDELYLLLSRLFYRRIANEPNPVGSWKSEANKRGEDVFARSYGRSDEEFNRISDDFSDRSTGFTSSEENDLPPLHPGRFDTEAEYIVANTPPHVLPAFQRKMLGIMGERAVGGGENLEASIKARVVPADFDPRSQDVFEPLDLILDLSKQLGAPGVRFLQLLGYLVPLPREYRDKFLFVYDSIKGQTKMSANRLIKEADLEFWKQIKGYPRRLGGGSLFSVFEVELKTGEHEVVRLLNPQARHHAEVFLNIIEKTIDALAKENPEYEQARPLVGLLREWIFTELEDKDFLEEDVVFRNKWNGQIINPAIQRKIVVPESYRTASPLVRREQLVEGDNFTKLASFPEAEQKELVAVAAQHYLSQIMSDENLIHSDISPGNLSRTKDGDVAILDRGMYLKLSEDERAFLMGLAIAEGPQQQAEGFLNWLWKLPANAEKINKLNRGEILAQILEKLKSNVSDPEEAILETLVVVHSKGLQVPLNITLLFKNLNVFHRLAKQVGLGSLKGALQYNPESPARSESRVQEVLDQYDLGEVTESSHPNPAKENISILESEKGKFILKQPLYRNKEDLIVWENSVLNALENDAAQIVKNREGEYFTQTEDGRIFIVYEMLEGRELGWGKVEGEDLEAAASLLAKVHNKLKDFQPLGRNYEVQDRPQVISVLDFGSGLKRLKELHVSLSARSPPENSKVENLFLEEWSSIETTIASIRKRFTLEILRQLPVTIVHGDFHQGNMRFAADGSVHLFDFEFAAHDARIYDLVGPLTIRYAEDGSSFALDKVRTFILAYDKYNPLTKTELDLLPDLFRLGYLEAILLFAGKYGKNDKKLGAFIEQVLNMKLIDSQDWAGFKQEVLSSRYEPSAKSEVRSQGVVKGLFEALNAKRFFPWGTSLLVLGQGASEFVEQNKSRAIQPFTDIETVKDQQIVLLASATPKLALTTGADYAALSELFSKKVNLSIYVELEDLKVADQGALERLQWEHVKKAFVSLSLQYGLTVQFDFPKPYSRLPDNVFHIQVENPNQGVLQLQPKSGAAISPKGLQLITEDIPEGGYFDEALGEWFHSESRSEMRAPERPEDFGSGEYVDFPIGGPGDVPDPEHISGVRTLRRIETRVIPLEIDGQKIINRFSLPDLTFRILDNRENVKAAGVGPDSDEVYIVQPQFLLQVWMNNEWQSLDYVDLEIGIPIVIKRGYMPRALQQGPSSYEFDLESEDGFSVGYPETTRSQEPRRTAIFWSDKEGVQHTVYLPRQTYDNEMSRGVERTEGRPTYNTLTQEVIPDYTQTGHVEIEIVEHPDYGIGVKFADQGSTFRTHVEVSRQFLQENNLLMGPVSQELIASRLDEVNHSVIMGNSLGKIENIVPGGDVDFKYDRPFYVAAIVRGEPLAAAEFHVNEKGILFVFRSKDNKWVPVANNKYLAEEGVPVAGHSALDLGKSIMLSGAYTVTYDPEKNTVKIHNQSASNVRVTFQPSFNSRSETRSFEEPVIAEATALGNIIAEVVGRLFQAFLQKLIDVGRKLGLLHTPMTAEQERAEQERFMREHIANQLLDISIPEVDGKVRAIYRQFKKTGRILPVKADLYESQFLALTQNLETLYDQTVAKNARLTTRETIRLFETAKTLFGNISKNLDSILDSVLVDTKRPGGVSPAVYEDEMVGIVRQLGVLNRTLRTLNQTLEFSSVNPPNARSESRTEDLDDQIQKKRAEVKTFSNWLRVLEVITGAVTLFGAQHLRIFLRSLGASPGLAIAISGVLGIVLASLIVMSSNRLIRAKEKPLREAERKNLNQKRNDLTSSVNEFQNVLITLNSLSVDRFGISTEFDENEDQGGGILMYGDDYQESRLLSTLNHLFLEFLDYQGQEKQFDDILELAQIISQSDLSSENRFDIYVSSLPNDNLHEGMKTTLKKLRTLQNRIRRKLIVLEQTEASSMRSETRLPAGSDSSEIRSESRAESIQSQEEKFRSSFGEKTLEVLRFVTGSSVDPSQVQRYEVEEVSRKNTPIEAVPHAYTRIVLKNTVTIDDKVYIFYLRFNEKKESLKAAADNYLRAEYEITQKAFNADVTYSATLIETPKYGLSLIQKAAPIEAVKIDSNIQDLEIVEAIGEALGKLHSADILHTDLIKLRNAGLREGNWLLVGEGSGKVVRIIDFEFSRDVTDKPDGSAQLESEMKNVLRAIQTIYRGKESGADVQASFNQGYARAFSRSEVRHDSPVEPSEVLKNQKLLRLLETLRPVDSTLQSKDELSTLDSNSLENYVAQVLAKQVIRRFVDPTAVDSKALAKILEEGVVLGIEVETLGSIVEAEHVRLMEQSNLRDAKNIADQTLQNLIASIGDSPQWGQAPVDGTVAIAFHVTGTVTTVLKEAFEMIGPQKNFVAFVSGDATSLNAKDILMQTVGNLSRFKAPLTVRAKGAAEPISIKNRALPTIQLAGEVVDISENAQLYDVATESSEVFGAFSGLVEAVSKIAAAIAAGNTALTIEELKNPEVQKAIAARLLNVDMTLLEQLPDNVASGLVTFKNGKLFINQSILRLANEHLATLATQRAA